MRICSFGGDRAGVERRAKEAHFATVRIDDDGRCAVIDRVVAVAGWLARVDEPERVRQARELLVAAGRGDEILVEVADVFRQLPGRVARRIDRDEIEADLVGNAIGRELRERLLERCKCRRTDVGTVRVAEERDRPAAFPVGPRQRVAVGALQVEIR